MALLLEREALILALRQKHTLEEIGRRLNISRERVRQIEAKARRRIRCRGLPEREALILSLPLKYTLKEIGSYLEISGEWVRQLAIRANRRAQWISIGVPPEFLPQAAKIFKRCKAILTSNPGLDPGELCAIPERELLKYPWVGRKTAQSIKKVMSRMKPEEIRSWLGG